MTGRDLLLVVTVDLLAFLAVATFAAHVLRRGTPSDPVPGMTVLLAVAGAVLILVALPFPWARARGAHGLASLTGTPSSSLVACTAGLLSVTALLLAAELGRRGGSVVVPLVSVVVGSGWTLLALDSLLLSAGVNRVAESGGGVEVGPAVWLCLLGGLLAITAGSTSIRRSAATSTIPHIPTEVDEWGMPVSPGAQTHGTIDGLGMPRTPSQHEKGDEW